MSKTLASLPVGSVVKSTGTKYNGAVIRWIVGTQVTGKTGLVAEKILTIKAFDAKEASNSDSNRRNYGNNRYSLSNIDKWLNSAAAAGAWWSATHSADVAPSSTSVVSYNPYSSEAGFLANFEADFRSAILNTSIIVAKNTVTDGGGSETITRKVFLLSNTEVGLANENSIAEGVLWTYFNSADRRKCNPTAEAVSQSAYTSSSLNASSPWYWWLRTPFAGYSYYARLVYPDGSLNNHSAYYGHGGVRPALFLESGVLVSDTTDSDGAYIIMWNQPPTDPSSISHGTPVAGKPLTLTTGGSTDPEGDAITYTWERRVDSGSWVQIGTSTAKTITDTVPTSGTNYQVRVKATDSNGSESGYCTGTATPINYNTPPVISGADGDLGASTDPITYNYTVTDAEAASQTLTVTESVTNNGVTKVLRTYRATSGAQNTAALSDSWLELLAGAHTLTIVADDGNGGSATRTMTFSRTVSRIAAARCISTDALVKKVFLSIYPDKAADATLHCEVTNNPFDDSPVWEDVSGKVGTYVHTFTNATAANGYGLAYRFYLLKDSEKIEVSQVTVRFA